jgi:pyruvate formate-lyase activating enzyme-like uncharacterized protein
MEYKYPAIFRKNTEKGLYEAEFPDLPGCTAEGQTIEEAETMDATGTGITGGDPFLDADRTVEMIKMLKKRFGKDHHIHLYTSAIDFGKTMAAEAAGLDEIRFHPPADVWKCIETTDLEKILLSAKMDVGIEVPALPDMAEDLEKLVSDAVRLGIGFININELEFSESNWNMMSARRYGLKDELSSAVLDSDKTAKRIMKKFKSANLHFCSSSFKDSVQLRKRLIRTAEKNAKEYEEITEDGTLMKGLVYADDLNSAAEMLRSTYGIPDGLMFIDPVGKRIEIAPWIIEEIAKELPFECCIVEEYPTADRLEVERMPL